MSQPKDQTPIAAPRRVDLDMSPLPTNPDRPPRPYILETEVEIDLNLRTKQSFLVHGIREYGISPMATMFELCDLALKWFATQPEVWKWRSMPRIDLQTDFATGKCRAHFHARGFFDVDVRLADHVPISHEL